ncbi:MAG: ABC transporter permease [Bacteroidota bacterium]
MRIPSHHRLPNWAVAVLEWLCPSRNRDVVVGDFAEVYHRIASRRGTARATVWYLGHLIRSLPSFLVERASLAFPLIRAYGTGAMRHLGKRKLTSTLNIAGLAIGMATCLVIFHYVAYESGYDKFHHHQEDLYRVVVDGVAQGNGATRSATTWQALDGAMRERLPGIAHSVRVHPNGVATVAYRSGGGAPQIYRQPGGLFVDPSFFEVFSYHMVQGDARHALSSTDQLLVSASMARTYFGDDDPIGKTLHIEGWTQGAYTVTGVFADPPMRSHLRFDYLLPMQSLLALRQYSESSGWTWQNFTTYVQLRPDSEADALAPLLTAMLREHTVEAFALGEQMQASLQPITEIHLLSSGEPGVAYWRVYLFGVIGLLVLVMAWVNFVNLTTARSAERAGEVGVRKAIGASRGNLVAQFVVEAIVTNGVALLLASVLVVVSLPFVHTLLGVRAGTEAWMDPTLWLSVAGLFLLGTLLSCLYPASVLSRQQPITIIKSQAQPASFPGGLRRVLVVLQFSAATALLIGTVGVFSQLQFMESRDLGVQLDHILVVEAPSRTDRRGTPDVFRQALLALPEVEAVSSGAVPGTGFFMDMPARRLGSRDTDAPPFQGVFVDDTFLATYDLHLVAGRNFADAQTDGLSTVLNEAGVRLFGFASNDAALGQRIVFDEDESNYVTVIGVVEDFNWMSVRERVGAVGFLINRSEGPFSIKVTSDDLEGTLASVQEAFRAVYPASPYDYFFADERFDAQYHAERRSGVLFGVFSFLALLVGCLGLIGLVAHTVSQRTREIGIRKVMGATPERIASLLVAGLAKSLGVALPVAVLVSYLGIRRWLEAYATRIELTPWLFLVPCCAVFVVALLTVSYQTLRAAHRDPIAALRSS